MRDVCSLIWLALTGLFRSRASLQVEILTLRHQLNVLRRKSPQRLGFTSIDRHRPGGWNVFGGSLCGAIRGLAHDSRATHFFKGELNQERHDQVLIGAPGTRALNLPSYRWRNRSSTS